MAKIPKKVMLVEEYKDGSTLWRVPCDCTDPDHDIKLWFDIDEDGFYGALNLETQIGWYPRYHDNWFKRVAHRVKSAFAILFLGRYRLMADVVLQKEGVEGLQYALAEGLKAMDRGSKQRARERDARLAKKNTNESE